MCKQHVLGPYQVAPRDLDTYETLDGVDIGAWYLLINGAFHFVENEQRGKELRALLGKLVKPRPRLYILSHDWYGAARGNVFYLARSPGAALMRAGIYTRAQLATLP
jgi:hypothetical protein